MKPLMLILCLAFLAVACTTSQPTNVEVPAECPECIQPQTITKYVCLGDNRTVVDSPDDCLLEPPSLVITKFNMYNDSDSIVMAGEVLNNGTISYQGNYKVIGTLYKDGKVLTVQTYGNPRTSIFGGQTKGFQITFDNVAYDDYKIEVEQGLN